MCLLGKFPVIVKVLLVFIILSIIPVAYAEEPALELSDALKGLKLGGEAFVTYMNGETGLKDDQTRSFNEFRLTRGYVTVEKEIQSWLGARATMDVRQDDTGDYKERLKYYYGWVKPEDVGLFTQMKSEIGMGHMPWLDFEESINPYRAEGTMAIERAGIYNSADLGVSLGGNFGGKLENAKETVGSEKYSGRFGSWHVGVFNGPGYATTEKNNNKVLEYRVTARPLPDVVPGLQLSYFGLYGEGNTPVPNTTNEFPDYKVNLGMLSYQNPMVIFTGQYFMTNGNNSGSLVDASGDALKTAGYSLFGNVKLPVLNKKFSVFARYDHADADEDEDVADNSAYSLYIAGVAWDIYKGNMLLLAYELTDYEENSAGKGKVPAAGTDLADDNLFEAVWRITF